ncbi:MAG TPA: HAD-IIA family hydrolase [Rugosimonospora sp.]|nr:HAD-IIA family hydrolase [Rugosimonospora sp.]
MTAVVPGPLVDGYDLLIFDLDGVVVLGSEAVPYAVEAVNRLYAEGRRVAYATNNASRSPVQVAALLGGLGIGAVPDEVITSPQAAAELLAGRLPAGAKVLVVGSGALADEVAAAGLEPVWHADDGPVAVVQGYDAGVGWAQLAEGCVAVRAGALWVATNADRTLPSPRGPLPGNGALVAALATALDRQPDEIVGKPAPGLFAQAARRVGAGTPLVVGDRLDTDIEGAVRAGMPSLLVLTGVATPADLLAAPPSQRPSHVAADLRGLFTAGGTAALLPGDSGAGRAEGNGWRVRRHEHGIELSGDGTPVDALAVLCAVAWGTPGVDPDAISAGNPGAATALRALGLD